MYNQNSLIFFLNANIMLIPRHKNKIGHTIANTEEGGRNGTDFPALLDTGHNALKEYPKME